MAIEIERKFLVTSDNWKSSISRQMSLRQGYMTQNDNASVRVRIQDNSANINIKSMTLGIERLEYEYAIPVSDAEEMLDQLCHSPLIEKTRYHVEHAGFVWEIDEFFGDNDGLVVAEIELESSEQVFELPEWAGKDVSHLERYYNVSLVKCPFCDWTQEEKSGV